MNKQMPIPKPAHFWGPMGLTANGYDFFMIKKWNFPRFPRDKLEPILEQTKSPVDSGGSFCLAHITSWRKRALVGRRLIQLAKVRELVLARVSLIPLVVVVVGIGSRQSSRFVSWLAFAGIQFN